MDINVMKVMPKSNTSFIGFKLFSQTKNYISNPQIKKIKKIPGIKSVQKILRLNLPAYLKVGFLGRYMRTDILISGAERSFFRGSKINWKKFRSKEHVPVIVPYFALDLYNNFAAVNNLPEFGEKALLDFPLDIVIGSSSFMGVGPYHDTYNAKIYGFTSALSTTGIVVPSEFIRDFCKKYNTSSASKKSCFSSVMLFVKAKSTGQLPSVVKKIQQLGLNVESNKDIAEKTRKALSFIDGAFSLLMTIILILTVIAIFNAYLAIVYSRSQEISLTRVLGVSKVRIVVVFILEAGLVGIIYGLAGYYLGKNLVFYLAKYIGQLFPLMKGLKMTTVSLSLLPVSIGISAIVSILSAMIPAIVASNLNLYFSVNKLYR